VSYLGLLVTVPSIPVYGRENCIIFSPHKLELCTAWYFFKLLIQDQLKCINFYWDHDNYTMVWRFYSGITGLNHKEVLNSVLPCKLLKSQLPDWK